MNILTSKKSKRIAICDPFCDSLFSKLHALVCMRTVRQIGKKHGRRIRHGQTLHRRRAARFHGFQRLGEQEHAAHLPVSVHIAEPDVVPGKI